MNKSFNTIHNDKDNASKLKSKASKLKSKAIKVKKKRQAN